MAVTSWKGGKNWIKLQLWLHVQRHTHNKPRWIKYTVFVVLTIVVLIVVDWIIPHHNHQLKFNIGHSDNDVMIGFDNNPLSPYRPSNQFMPIPHILNHHTPVLTILTVTRNPNLTLLRDTMSCILHQSLQLFTWIIVSDHSNPTIYNAMCQELMSIDSRIQIIENEYEPGVAYARQYSIDIVNTPYYIFVDDDDLFELVYLEKAVWMLESNPNLHIISPYHRGFGDLNYTWNKGFHNGLANYYESTLLGAAPVYRTQSIRQSGCEYDITLNLGAEDWDFYMCLASNNVWGNTIPEYLFWYRTRDNNNRSSKWKNLYGDTKSEKKQMIQAKYSELENKSIHSPDIQDSSAYEYVNWTLPFNQQLDNTVVRDRVLLVIPWTAVGGADVSFLYLVRQLGRNGYAVTIVCTLYHPPISIAMLDEFYHYTHDVFILPTFLRLSDWARFIVYLISSRQISYIIMSNSMWFGESLPSIIEHLNEQQHNNQLHLPRTPYILDLVHMVEPNWKNGGHAKLSLLNGNYIHRTIAASKKAHDWLIDHGRYPDSVGLLYLGIDVDQFRPVADHTEQEQSKQLVQQYLVPNLSIRKDSVLIIMIARIAEQKRPQFAVKCIQSLLDRLIHNKIQLDVKFIMAGSGPLKDQVNDDIYMLNLQHNIALIQNVQGNIKQELMRAADIFFMPSYREGLSYSAAEAMTMSIPFVGTNSGGLNELVDTPHGGILVHSTQLYNTSAYVEYLYELCVDSMYRRNLGQAGRRRATKLFDASSNLQDLIDSHFPAAVSNTPIKQMHTNGYVHSHLYYANQHALLEDHQLTDLADGYKRLHQLPTRHGDGDMLQQRCGEMDEQQSFWINSVVNSRTCADSVTHAGIVTSAKLQCFQWCIFNISASGLDGWELTGSGCFVPYKQGETDTPCIQIFAHLKPAVVQ